MLGSPLRAQDAAPSDMSQTTPSWSASFGGELRERFESSRYPAFGLREPERNAYFLHRAVLFGELRHAEDLLAYVEVVSGRTAGWAGSPPPTQDDALDASQAYIRSSFAVARGEVALLAGRQALALGASRLVSSRESPNIRRAFDGLKVSWTEDEQYSVTAFFVRPVMPHRGVFDDSSSAEQRFWGVYATLPITAVSGLFTDVYYLALDRVGATFAVGSARERRHTVGARAFGAHQGWDWDVETARQWGSFGQSSIRAWTVSIDVGFELVSLPLSPRVGLKADAISGDRNPQDRVLGTFNPLFPKLPYFSEANLATPANLLDAQPNVRFEFPHGLYVRLGWNGLWKHASADAFYSPPLAPVDGTTRTSARYIGWQASSSIEWQATAQVEFAVIYVSFEPGSVARQSGGRSGSFFGAWVQWAF
jgi:hypothetical protein